MHESQVVASETNPSVLHLSRIKTFTARNHVLRRDGLGRNHVFSFRSRILGVEQGNGVYTLNRAKVTVHHKPSPVLCDTHRNVLQIKMKKEWHNPDPSSLGEIVSETQSDGGRNKAVVFRMPSGNLMVHGYVLDDSDLVAGFSDSIGWVSEAGPSIVDNLSDAEALVQEYLSRGKD